VDNATPEELGLALLGFQLLAKQEVRLGGATSRGLGVVSLDGAKYCEYSPTTPEGIVAWLFGDVEQGQELDPKELVNAAIKDLQTLKPRKGENNAQADDQ